MVEDKSQVTISAMINVNGAHETLQRGSQIDSTR